MTHKLNNDNDLLRRWTKNTSCQHCIRAIAGEVLKSRSVHLINFGGSGQVITLKSATALILDRWASFEKEPTAQIAHLVFANTQANTKKPKELFFSQRSDKKRNKKSNFTNGIKR